MNDRAMTAEEWYAAIPKAELHLHLEGALPLEALRDLVGKYEPGSPWTDLEKLRQKFVYRDFMEFLGTWYWKNQYLREYEDFTFMAEAVAGHLAAQHIRYGELFFSPSEFSDRGLTVQGLAQAIRKGFDRVPDVEIHLIADLVRNFGAGRAAETLAAVSEARGYGIIGIGIGGAEKEYPAGLFQQVYQKAREMGFHVTAHAGEADGCRSIWDALRLLKAGRIGHGTRAFEDEALVDYLAGHRVPLEMCPLSNIMTGVTKSMEEHPVRRYWDRGLLVTVNTDDPGMFGNSMVDELKALAMVHHFTPDEIRKLVLNALEASWLEEDRKRGLIESFAADPSWHADIRVS